MNNAKNVRQPSSPTNTRPVAYSYMRFSHGEQAKGHSIERQTAARDKWVSENHVILDTSLRIDRGVSGFEGKNRENADRHGLAAFLHLIEQRKVQPGSFLIVENLDRLSREHIRPALTLLLNLIDKGIRVVQLLPTVHVFDDRVEPMELMMAIMELSRGHGESQMKSERVGPAWQKKKKEARTVGTPLGKMCPAWCVPTMNGKRVTGYTVDERKAETVRMMFRWGSEGLGIHAITRKLNAEKVRAIAGVDHWSHSYVGRIMSGVAVLGLHQPCLHKAGRRTPDGPPVKLYPQVIEQKLYDTVRGIISKNKRPGRGVEVVNLFVGLIQDPATAKPWHMRRGPGGAGRYLVSYATHIGQQDGPSMPLPALEAGLLTLLREVDSRDVLPRTDSNGTRLEQLAGQREQLEGQIGRIRAQLRTASDVSAVVQTLREMELDLEAVVDEAAVIRQQTATPLSESWGELGELAKLAEQGPEVRTRLRSVIRRVIERIDMRVIRFSRRERTAALVVRFVGGTNMLMAVTSIAGCGGGGRGPKAKPPTRSTWHAMRRLKPVTDEYATQWLNKESCPVGLSVINPDELLAVRKVEGEKVQRVEQDADDWEKVYAEVVAEIQQEERKAPKKTKKRKSR